MMPDRMLTIDEEYEAEKQDQRDEWFLLHFSKSEAELLRLEKQAEALRKALRPEGWR